MTPGEVTAVLREHLLNARAEHDAQIALAWHTAALHRAKRMPRLRALLGRRRRKAPTVMAPAEMTAERRRRIEHLARGLTLADDVDPYKRPDDGGDE